MIYLKESKRSVADVAERLTQAARAVGFGVLHEYDFRQTLESKGFPFEHECRVLELCNPAQAAQVLSKDMALSLALPCRVAVYEEGGKTVAGIINPPDLLPLVSTDPSIQEAADAVTQSMRQAIDAAV